MPVLVPCAPFLQAVCCKDHHHCCARDTICDPTTDKCLSHALDLPWQETMPTRSSHPENPKHITVGGIKEEQEVEQTESRTRCPDGTPCTDNETCCKGKEIGQWGCCPLPHVRILETLQKSTPSLSLWFSVLVKHLYYIEDFMAFLNITQETLFTSLCLHVGCVL